MITATGENLTQDDYRSRCNKLCCGLIFLILGIISAVIAFARIPLPSALCDVPELVLMPVLGIPIGLVLTCLGLDTEKEA